MLNPLQVNAQCLNHMIVVPEMCIRDRFICNGERNTGSNIRIYYMVTTKLLNRERTDATVKFYKIVGS